MNDKNLKFMVECNGYVNYIWHSKIMEHRLLNFNPLQISNIYLTLIF